MRDERTILILTEQFDPTADYLIEHLDERGAAFVRLDTGDFPAQWSIAALSGLSGWTGGIDRNGEFIPFEHINSVWYRRPTVFTVPDEVPPGQRKFIVEESRAAVGGLLRSLPAVWVDRPDRIANAGFKPYQLKIAAESGFQVPETMITNIPEKARRFVSDASVPILTKSMATGWISEGSGIYSSFYTSILDSDLQSLDRVRNSPALLQYFVPKAYEVRVTVIGKEIYAVEIHSTSPESYIDWRTAYSDLRYKPHQLTDSVKACVRTLMEHFELEFGAIDLIVTPDGDYYFLEINPCGQWAWLEQEVGYPMRRALANLLLENRSQ
jgi:ATP-grasp ribosomal peptide maturase